jgi:hypothetical protein
MCFPMEQIGVFGVKLSLVRVMDQQIETMRIRFIFHDCSKVPSMQSH